MKNRVYRRLWLLLVHLTNLASAVLGDDSLSCKLRRTLLQLLGAQLGPETRIKGGGYFYGGSLITGKACFINRNCYFDFTSSITIGNNVVVGHGVTFITAEHQIGDATKRAGAVSGKPIVIGDGAWIGANVTILPGITIGRGAVVGAGAVVTKDVPENTIVAGVPAKVIKELEGLESVSREQSFSKN